MDLLPTVIFLALFVPVVAIACVAVAEHRREPGRWRPMTPDAGGGGCDGGSFAGEGGCDGG